MVKYELKKIFGRPLGRLSLVVLAAALAVTCFFALRVPYVNDQGETEYGLAAIHQLRVAQKAWAGPLDEAKLRAVIEANNAVNASPEAQSDDVQELNMAFSRKQGFNPIRDLLNSAYAEGFRTYDYYRADSLTPDDATAFYENRVTLLADWLAAEGEGEDQFTPAEKAWLLDQYRTLKSPWQMDCFLGWQQLFEYAPTVVMITALVLGFLAAGIFSCEGQWRADAIFFTTRHGRDKGSAAKVWAGVLVVTVLYWLAFLIFSGLVLGVLGADGGACPIQVYLWKSPYQVTLRQSWLLIALGGYLGCLFLSAVTMLVSAKTGSGMVSAVIPFVLIFLPALLLGDMRDLLQAVLGLLPDRLLQFSRQLTYFDLYQFGDRVIPAVPLLLGMYSVLTPLLFPACHLIYRRKQLR
ncbi:MAG: ABC transporter permease [Bacillota bacterium]|nr:ABC transporter permease [Bacillota bacterium]